MQEVMNPQLDSPHLKPKRKNKKPQVKKEDTNESVQNQEYLSRNARRRQRQKQKKESDSTEIKSDGINTKEILKLMLSLHKGQESIKDLDQKILEKFFSTDVDMLKWFEESKLFTVFCNDATGQPEIVSVFIKDARLCFNYKAGKGSCTGMLKGNKPCRYLHLCRDHVRGNCPKAKCTIAHNMTTKHNGVLRKKLGLGKLPQEDALLAVRCSNPMVCEEYNTMGKCSQAILGRCLQFHVCNDFLLGKCQNEQCPRCHEFKDTRRLSEYRIDKLPNNVKAKAMIPLIMQDDELEGACGGSEGALSRTESLASLSGSSDYYTTVTDSSDSDNDDDDVANEDEEDKPEPHEEFEHEPKEYAAEPQDECHDEASESYQEYPEVRSLCFTFIW